MTTSFLSCRQLLEIGPPIIFEVYRMILLFVQVSVTMRTAMTCLDLFHQFIIAALFLSLTQII